MIRQSKIAHFIMLNESLGMRDLSGSPMTINAMKVLMYIRDNDGIVLTKSGAFYRKFVTWAAEVFRWPGYEAEELYRVNKVLNELDFVPLAVMHDLLIAARLIRRYKGKALLSQSGKRIIGDYGALQAELFDTYFTTFDHFTFERLPIAYHETDYVHFFGIVQNRLADWVPLTELAGWCLPLDLVTRYRFSPVEDASYYLLSCLVRPLCWLGMLECHPEAEKYGRPDRLRYRKTPLLDHFMSFKLVREGSWAMH